MTTKNFIDILKDHKGKALLFEYAENEFAGTNYHLTEVKNVHFETVDCGGNKNNWKETHFQLWESPNEVGKEDYMTVDKVTSIINRVDNINPLWLDTEAKFEFGNASFHTSILNASEIESNSKQLIIKLFPTATGCKAPDTCGVEVEETSNETSCCDPVSGCC